MIKASKNDFYQLRAHYNDLFLGCSRMAYTKNFNTCLNLTKQVNFQYSFIHDC